LAAGEHGGAARRASGRAGDGTRVTAGPRPSAGGGQGLRTQQRVDRPHLEIGEVPELRPRHLLRVEGMALDGEALRSASSNWSLLARWATAIRSGPAGGPGPGLPPWRSAPWQSTHWKR